MSIASEITRLTSAKAELKKAIIAKGVAVGDDVKLDGYADKVNAIEIGGGVEYPVPWRNDGKIHYWLHIDDHTVGETIIFQLSIKTEFGAVVYWGDGSSDSIQATSALTSRAIKHTYDSEGDYEVVFEGIDDWSVSNYWSGQYSGSVGTSNFNPWLVRSVRQIEMGVNSKSFDFGSDNYGRTSNLCAISVNTESLSGIPPFSLRMMKILRNGNATLVDFNNKNMIDTVDFNGYQNCTNITRFAYCESLREVDIGMMDSLTSLGSESFRHCRSLRRLVLPLSITTIANYSFVGVELDEMIVKSLTPPTVGGTSGLPASIARLVVPKGTIDTYKAANQWSRFASKMVEAEV